MAPLRATATLREATTLVSTNLPTYLKTVGIFVLAAAAISFGLDALAPDLIPDPETLAADENPAANAGTAARVMVTGLIVSLVLGVIMGLGIAAGVVVSDTLTRGGPAPTLGTTWARIAPRAPNYLATILIAAVAVTAILLAGAVLSFLIVPWITALALTVWIALRWSLLPPVSLLENHPVTENFDRSHALTDGHKVGIFLVFLILAAVGFTLLTVGALALEPLGTLGTYLFVAYSTLVQLGLAPVWATTLTLMHRDLTAADAPGDLPNGL